MNGKYLINYQVFVVTASSREQVSAGSLAELTELVADGKAVLVSNQNFSGTFNVTSQANLGNDNACLLLAAIELAKTSGVNVLDKDAFVDQLTVNRKQAFANVPLKERTIKDAEVRRRNSTLKTKISVRKNSIRSIKSEMTKLKRGFRVKDQQLLMERLERYTFLNKRLDTEQRELFRMEQEKQELLFNYRASAGSAAIQIDLQAVIVKVQN